MSGVVVDTSVWIDFLAGLSMPLLEDALKQGAVILPPIVVAELMAGARREPEQALIMFFLRKLPLHETPLAHWIQVGHLRRVLRNHGVSVSTPDAHVAQCALDRDAMLLSRDAIFPHIARYSPLRLYAS